MSKQDYIDHALASLPKWFRDQDRPMEVMNAFAEMYCRVEAQIDHWHEMSFILTAYNEPPDWLNQHAIDRGTYRQAGESDTNLRERLRSFPDAVTFTSLLDSLQGLLDAEGIVGTPVMVELPRHVARSFQHVDPMGVGGTFSLATDGNMLFTPDPALTNVPVVSGNYAKYIGNWQGTKFVFSGSSSAGNDGSFDIIGFEGNGMKFVNGSGVAETDATVTWTSQKINKDGFALATHRRSYLDRGYRIGGTRPTLLIILPFGCTPSTLVAAAELLRQTSGAGVATVVECREIP